MVDMTGTRITVEGKPVTDADFHVEGKMLWVKMTLEDGRKFDLPVQKADRKEVIELTPHKGT